MTSLKSYFAALQQQPTRTTDKRLYKGETRYYSSILSVPTG
jgi:hypothetical protein